MPKVLVVDDALFTRKVLCEILEAKGRLVTEVGSLSVTVRVAMEATTQYAEIANAVLLTAAETLEGLAELTIERGRLQMQESTYTEEDITVVISVDGAVKGLILLELAYRTAFRMLQWILGEKLDTKLPASDFLRESELVRSALQELANILGGPLLIWCGERVVGVGHPCRKNGRLVVRIEQWRGVTTSSSLPTNHETEEGAERAQS